MRKNGGQRSPARLSIVNQQCTGLLSFHCWEREVFAALWNQPHAVPSTSGTSRPKPSPKSQGPSLNLERASQGIAQTGPAMSAEPSSHHFNALTQVTSWRYTARQLAELVMININLYRISNVSSVGQLNKKMTTGWLYMKLWTHSSE